MMCASKLKPKNVEMVRIAASEARRSYSNFNIHVDDFNIPHTSQFSMKEKEDSLVKIKKKEPHKSKRKVVTVEANPRMNELGVQMLSNSLYSQIFGKDVRKFVNTENVPKILEELKKFGVWEELKPLPDVELELPKLEASNIEQHFWEIGNQQSAPYKKLLLEFSKVSIPEPPKEWLCSEGWTCYKEGFPPLKVSYPDEDIVVFDVEVCLSVGQAPTLATAVSPTAWYGWVSPSLPSNVDPLPIQHYTPNLFIPMEGKGTNKSKERLIIGHNVSYDRARIKEQYRLESSSLRFMDTMSMHVAIGGVTSYQRAMLKTKIGLEDSEWREYSSLNSLKEVYKLYCKGELSKETRNLFVDGKLSDIRDNFQCVMKYCAEDVMATFKISQKMTPMFFERFPHPVTLAGMLEMGTAFLPISSNWERYLIDSEQTYEDLEKECKFILTRKGDNACQLLNDDKYKDDLWMWDEDWSTQQLKLTKKKLPKKENGEEVELNEEEKLEETFAHLFDSAFLLPARKPHLPGYPLWYRKLCDKPGDADWVPGPQLISTGVRVTPKLLNLTWEKFPLHYTREHGWGILVADSNAQVDKTQVPYQRLKELTLKNGQVRIISGDKNVDADGLIEKVEKSNSKADYWARQEERNWGPSGGLWCDYVVEGCCHFLKLPHKNGAGNNVGNPLSKDVIKTFSKSVLAGSDKTAEKVLDISRMLSYWRNNKERICRQLAVWTEPGLGAILPQVVVCGTLTRRAMEPTWMTASNAQADRIGSELRSMVQAPPGYHFVGADVDSEELWIASTIGDASAAGMHAATPFGWMTLSGSKASGTDMHSVTAAASGISRDQAKVINYARIYGAGVRFAQRLLQQFNPEMSDTEAKTKANKMFLLTKGRRIYRLKREFRDQLPEETPEEHTSFSAGRIAKTLGKAVSEVFDHPTWIGGTESAMFNRLEKVALSRQPCTPFLSGRLSRAVEPRSEGDDSFLTTRVNWVVQSGAVDFLHLMLVSLRWLTQGKIRFCLSFHDEIRYLVPSHLRYEAALALQITNLLTRAFCARRLGLHDLPQSVAFFSSVDVDTVLRKETKDDCKTPSNPHGLQKGYGIPPGESLDIFKSIEKCGGKLVTLQPHKNTRYPTSYFL